MTVENLSHTFPSYESFFSHEDKLNGVNTLLRYNLKANDINPKKITDARSLAHTLIDRVNSLNSSFIWQNTLPLIGLRDQSNSVPEIIEHNASQIHDLAIITTSGILAGAEATADMVSRRYEEKSPVIEASLATIEQFEGTFTDSYDLMQRIREAYGTRDETGRLNTILHTMQSPIFEGQVMLEDMFRLYGQETIDRLETFI